MASHPRRRLDHTTLGLQFLSYLSFLLLQPLRVQAQECAFAGTNSAIGLHDCSPTTYPIITLGGTPATINPSGVTITATDLSVYTVFPGKETIVGSQTVSLGLTDIVVDSSTYNFGSPTSLNLPIVTLGGEPATLDPSGLTLSPAGGKPVTVFPGKPTLVGTNTISIGSTAAVIDGSTILIPILPTIPTVPIIPTSPGLPTIPVLPTSPDLPAIPIRPTTPAIPTLTTPLTFSPTFSETVATVTSGSSTTLVPITVVYVTGTSGTASGKTTGITFVSSSTSTSGVVNGKPTSYHGGSWSYTSGGGGGGFPPPPLGEPTPGPPGGTDDGSDGDSSTASQSTSAESSCTSTATVSHCIVTVSSFTVSGQTALSTATTTSCSTVTGCGATASTTSTTASVAGPQETAVFVDVSDWDGDTNWLEEAQSYLGYLQTADIPLITSSPTWTASPITSSNSGVATPNPTIPVGQAVAPGIQLRILPLGDSITWGYASPDGNGYRLRLLNDLKADNVTYAGTQCNGNMTDHWNEGYPGQTISYIASHMVTALDQGPNLVLLHAGTNDLLPDNSDPNVAAQALGTMIDQIIKKLPDAVLLVAQLINAEDSQGHENRTLAFNKLVPGIVQSRYNTGSKVLVVNFASIGGDLIRPHDVHPTEQGYLDMGDIWYNATRGIPHGWIKPAAINATAPLHPPCPGSGGQVVNPSANGGLDQKIPPPDYGPSPVVPSSKAQVSKAADAASAAAGFICTGAQSTWQETGEIALGLGRPGNWHFTQNWVEAGKVADGLHLNPSSMVHLADMDGDGKADYLWVDPESGALTCWLNKLPGAWSPAGTNTGNMTGIIASGAGAGAQVFFADMNSDGLAEYLVVDGNTGSVTVYWNEGPGPNVDNGWRFVPGGVIASGVPHANLATLRFPDLNGDGRADYVYIGEDGALGAWLNTGQPGSHDVVFEALGGIATGAESNLSRISLEDIDGDQRSDYLIWDQQGGLSGFLNIRTQREGVPFFANQGGPKSIAQGIGQDPSTIILADLDGDGKKDYCYIDEQGAVWLWWNRGSADTSVTMDGLRLADMDGSGKDDYVWVNQTTGALTLYINGGPSSRDSLGWQWLPAEPPIIATGAGPAPYVHLADVTGDMNADYLLVDPVTGATQLWINGGRDPTAANDWRFTPVGEIATGLGLGKNVRFADIDGDGRADYILLGPHGEATVYRNQFKPNNTCCDFVELPAMDASGIGQRPEDISFYDVNGDGLADYIYTRAIDGVATVWLNNYGGNPAWLPPAGPFMDSGPGVSGQNIRWADLLGTGQADYVAVNQSSGAIAAWLNECKAYDPHKPRCQTPQNSSGTALSVFWEASSSGKEFGVGFSAAASVSANGETLATQVDNNSPSNENPWSAYWNGGAAQSFKVNGTLATGGSVCGQAGEVTFVKACDGSYNVVGVHGETGNCVSKNPTKTDYDLHTNITGVTEDVEVRLYCTGALCS